MADPYPLSQIPRCILAEGPFWDGRRLLYVDIEAGEIHRHEFTTNKHEVLPLGSAVGFVLLDREDRLIAGVGDGSIFRLQFDSTDRQLLALPARENPANLANDGKCDRRGRLWAGTKNIDETGPSTGSLARLDRNSRFDGISRLTEVLYPVYVSNGLAWSPDNTRMYYSESTDRIWLFDYDIETGQATNQRVFIQLPADGPVSLEAAPDGPVPDGSLPDGSVPDGITIDSHGRLYVAMWGGSRVDVFRDDNGQGRLVESIPVPTALQVSSVAFGGQDLRTLFITTAAVGLTPEQWSRYPDSGLIFALERNIPGLLETPFRD